MLQVSHMLRIVQYVAVLRWITKIKSSGTCIWKRTASDHKSSSKSIPAWLYTLSGECWRLGTLEDFYVGRPLPRGAGNAVEAGPTFAIPLQLNIPT
jgi:hypothetical protein